LKCPTEERNKKKSKTRKSNAPLRVLTKGKNTTGPKKHWKPPQGRRTGRSQNGKKPCPGGPAKKKKKNWGRGALRGKKKLWGWGRPRDYPG